MVEAVSNSWIEVAPFKVTTVISTAAAKLFSYLFVTRTACKAQAKHKRGTS